MGGPTRKIIAIAEMVTKNRFTMPKKVRTILRIKKSDYIMFTREKDGVLLRKLDRFALLDGEYNDQILIDGSEFKSPRAMNPQHVEILNCLKTQTLTGQEIAKNIDSTYDAVRGRISELKNTFGFNIILKKNKKYSWQD